ncbi:MAG: HAD family hydrolase [Erysipelotrichaceae bacterium]
MKYKCLVFDHDDTIVNSTATIHYPCFQQYLDQHFPGKKLTLRQYFEKNFHPGFLAMCRDDFAMSDQQIKEEELYWNDYVKKHIPTAYPLIRDIMLEHKRQGGIIAVSSHSFTENIIRDFKSNNLPMADVIYGWDLPEEKRKPAPYSLLDIIKKFNLSEKDLLMIDDAKAGYDMAKQCKVDFAAVGWSNDIKQIQQFMKENSDFYFSTVEELKDFLGY